MLTILREFKLCIKKTNPKYHALITKFKEKTDCSVVVNTSFNVRGEPIVCTPQRMHSRCFMGTEIDAVGSGELCLLRKDQQDHFIRLKITRKSMSWISREGHNKNNDGEKTYPFARLMSWLFLVGSHTAADLYSLTIVQRLPLKVLVTMINISNTI